MERWVMNRIGFVNFWVYDVEEFPFKDGKLLLRGSNGSGKSITTQSFIPYILDGDRQPSRLDPFGSKDRKMEYYLIGDSDSGKDESIGYLFLEFKKPQSGQYRTIGIGLHAKKGSKMNTWGFCILDGRRVGYDFMLYREVGSENIPYNSKQLKELLGDNNLYVEKVSDYKAMVAKQIFDIDSENILDFEQLTNILIKTRSSKLASKENLKPEQLYTILNESLQTLSDEELRPMADAMTKIDETHRRIEDGQNVLREIKYITAEYDRYNRYMLWKKADKYLKKHTSTSAIQNKVCELNDRIQQNTDDKANSDKMLGAAKIKKIDLEREKAALNYDDIKVHIENKNKAKENLEIEKVKFEKKQKQISDKKEKIDYKYRTLQKDKVRLEDVLYEIKKQINAFNEYLEFVPTLHNSYIKGITTDDRYFEQSEQCRKEIDSYSRKLQEILALIRERDRIKGELDLSEKSCDNAKDDMHNQESELKILEKMFNDEKDKIIENFYIAAKNNTEYSIDEIMLTNIEKMVCNYEGQGSATSLIALTSNRLTYLNKQLNQNISDCKSILKVSENDYNTALQELNSLKNSSDSIPERNELKSRARKVLIDKGIKCRSLYECIDFKDGLTDEQKAILEAELSDMGALDALVISKKEFNSVYSEIKNLSDCILSADCKDTSENPFFKVTAPNEIYDDIMSVINGMCKKSAITAELNVDGYYRNGILIGHSVSDNSARFIGAENRRKYRLEQIERLEQKCSELYSAVNTARTSLDNAENRLKALENEYNLLPDTGDLNEGLNLLNKQQAVFEAAQKEYNNANEKFMQVKQKYEDSCAILDVRSTDIPYRKTEENYRAAIEEIANYSNDLQSILSLIREKSDCTAAIENLSDVIDDLEEDIDSADIELKGIEIVIHECEEKIRLGDEFLNRPENLNIAEKVEKLNSEITEAFNLINQNEKIISKCDTQNELYNTQLDEYKTQLVAEIEEENTLANYFTEECDLEFVITDKSLTLNQSAERAMAAVSQGDEEKELGSIQERLNRAFRDHSNIAAADYNPMMSDCFEDSGSDAPRKRIKITLTWQNKQLTPYQFQKEISNAIENDKLLVKAEEEKMFTDILMDTVSKKLYVRINDSKRWVASMSELMQDINTSMGLSFSLGWKPKKDIGDNQMKLDDLCNILIKDKTLIRAEDYEKLSAHFRGKIEYEQHILEEKGMEVNYSELVKNVLDFRNWFEFRLLCKTAGAEKFSELTMSRFNTFSGGERALSLYIPLFAAVGAQYKKAGSQAPLILALDEAFAGVDESNISEMFGLLEKLGFGYIVNSQSLWGCYDTVSGLEIAELLHEKDTEFITVILYEWNGKKKTLVT